VVWMKSPVKIRWKECKERPTWTHLNLRVWSCSKRWRFPDFIGYFVSLRKNRIVRNFIQRSIAVKRASRPVALLCTETNTLNHGIHQQGGSRGQLGLSLPPKTYVSNFINHDFVQFRKQHSRYKAILPSIVLSQQCCEVHFISLTLVNP